MQLELYFRTNCGFSRSVLNTVDNLKIHDKIVMKDILAEPQFEAELIALCGDKQVPTLVVDGQPRRESEEIKKFLVAQFL